MMGPTIVPGVLDLSAVPFSSCLLDVADSHLLGGNCRKRPFVHQVLRWQILQHPRAWPHRILPKKPTRSFMRITVMGAQQLSQRHLQMHVALFSLAYRLPEREMPFANVTAELAKGCIVE